MLSRYINKLMARRDLEELEAFECFSRIMQGDCAEVQIAAFLTALRLKGETVAEITGAARAMRQKAAFIDTGMADVLDIVGTGGDSLGTFNISTTSCFVAAGAGVTVAKHGNRAISSRSGAADVLAELGFNLDVEPSVMECCIQEHGIGFLFAQKIHPAMRYAAPVRKALKMRTIFNLLGPLTNPAGARNHLIGVFAPEYTEVFAAVLKSLGSRHALIVHGADGLDEISPESPTRVCELKDGMIRTYELFPEMLLDDVCSLSDVIGGTPAENAAIMLDILRGRERGGKRAVVLLNAGAAIYAANAAKTIQEGVRKAADSIDSGAALKKLELLVEASK